MADGKSIGVQQTTDRRFKYVFVCGLHRSGTSLLGRNIARLDDCTGFKETGVIEDEGQYLQDVYPIGKTYGGAGKFGFDSRAHLTEMSPLLTPGNAMRLRQSWEKYWQSTKSIRVEKTPGNLLKTRFLQAAFPNSYFVVISRHPVAVSMATQRWKVTFASLHSLFDHWLHCHELFRRDKGHLKRVYELRYEDYIENPTKYHQEIAAFIGTHTSQAGMEALTGVHNQRYFDRWSYLLTGSFFKSYYQFLARKYDRCFAKYGYSLREGFGFDQDGQLDISRGSDVFGTLLCIGAEAWAPAVRVAARSKGHAKRCLKAALPEFALNKIRQARGRTAVKRVGEQEPGVGHQRSPFRAP